MKQNQKYYFQKGGGGRGSKARPKRSMGGVEMFSHIFLNKKIAAEFCETQMSSNCQKK